MAIIDRDWTNRVLNFWFDEVGADGWFRKDDAFDQRCVAEFGDLHAEISATPLTSLTETPETALAAIIVLDQLSRNMFRGTPRAFASDAMALTIAREAIERGFDTRVPANQRVFFYLPFEHSEARADQDRSVELTEALGDDNYLRYANAHRDVIVRFGRFPHRNAILGRQSTVEEEQYLAEPGSGF